MGAINGHHGLLMQETGVPPPATVTWNPIDRGTNIVLSNGNLTARMAANAVYQNVRATLGRATGKYYFEVRHDISTPANFSLIGICTSAPALNTVSFVSTPYGYGYYEQDGKKYYNSTGTSFGAAYTAADVIGVAVDLSTGKIWFSKNGTWQASGDPAAGTNEAYSGLSGTLFPALSLYSGGGISTVMSGRFKAADFSYSPPSGFSAWES